MHKIRAENFNGEAAECRRKAEEAASADKQAWLALAEDWSKLARGEDLIREWQRIHASTLWHWLARVEKWPRTAHRGRHLSRRRLRERVQLGGEMLFPLSFLKRKGTSRNAQSKARDKLES
jgi:hypothetical protein